MTRPEREIVPVPEGDVSLTDIVELLVITRRFRADWLDEEGARSMLAKEKSASRIDEAAGYFCRVTFLSPPPFRVPFPMDVSGLLGVTQVAQLWPEDSAVTHADLMPILTRTLLDYVRRVPEALPLPGFAMLSTEEIAADYAAAFPVPINRDGRTVWLAPLAPIAGLKAS